MVKAFYSLNQLKELYAKLQVTYAALNKHRGHKELTFKDKLVFEMYSFCLPLLEDFLANNLFSLQNYSRIKTILEASCLISVDGEESFKRVNEPLLEPQQAILEYSMYSGTKSPLSDSAALKDKAMEAMGVFQQAISRDEAHSFNMKASSVSDLKIPLLLGRGVEETVRTYLGYIFDAVYMRSGERIHLINYQGLEDRYELSFFNDVSRMITKVSDEYVFPGEGDKGPAQKETKSVENVYKDEKMALEAITKKITAHYKASFIGSALAELIKIEQSAKNDLINGRYYDLTGLFRLQLEFLTNVYLASDSSLRLLSFRLPDEKEETPEREGKFLVIKREGLDPNPAWENNSLSNLVRRLIALVPAGRDCEGMKREDYLYLRYKQAKNMVRGSGYLFYAPDEAFRFHKDDVILFDGLLYEILIRIQNSFKGIIDIRLEVEAMKQILIRKDALASKIAG